MNFSSRDLPTHRQGRLKPLTTQTREAVENQPTTIAVAPAMEVFQVAISGMMAES
jgi:hypothetical protein